MTCRFIELTEADTGMTYCYNIDIIRSFYENSDGETFVLVAGCGDWMRVTASYDDLLYACGVRNPEKKINYHWADIDEDDDTEGDTDGDR